MVAESTGYLNHDWIPRHEFHISVADLGFRQGVTAVERLRTYHGQVFQLGQHVLRWQQTLQALSIRFDETQTDVSQLILECVDRNREFVIAQGDVGITVFATPGDGKTSPTLGVHLNPLDFKVNQVRQEEGQPIVVTNVNQPSPACWPRTIKVRSRIHYYLADLQAKHVNATASGVLLDDNGGITETSISNIAIVNRGEIQSPPDGAVLPGVTEAYVRALAKQNGIIWKLGIITPKQLRSADEILLMGTDTGLWFANRIDEADARTAGDVYLRLKSAFEAAVFQHKN